MKDNRTVSATLRHLHIAPRKVRFVADVIRGMSVNEAEAHLLLSPRRPGEHIRKLLRSAVANAKSVLQIGEDALVIREIKVDGGPTMKRWMPRARGGAGSIAKRTSHVTVVLGTSEKSPKRRFVFVRETPKKKEVEKKPAKKKEVKGAQLPPHDHKEPGEGHEKNEGATRTGTRKGFLGRTFRRKSV